MTMPRPEEETLSLEERQFRAPWEARIFALVMQFVENGVIEWSDFQKQLVEEIRLIEQSGGAVATHEELCSDSDQEQHTYYQCWLRAVENLCMQKGIIQFGDMERHESELRAAVEAIREQQRSTA